MSLINQMLQDLDARRATHSAETKLPNDVRPLPAVSTPRWPWAIGVVFVVAGLGGAIWWRMHEAVMDEVAPTKVAVDQAPVQVVPVSPVSPVSDEAATVVAAAPAAEPNTGTALPPPVLEVAVADELQLAMSPSLDLSSSASQDSPAGVVATLPKENRVATAQATKAQVSEKRPKSAETAPADKPAPPQRSAPAAAVEAATTRAPAVKAAEPAIQRTEVQGSGAERAESAYRKAIAAVNEGRVGEATDALRTALKADAKHVASRQLLVKLLLEGRQSDDAMGVLDAGLQQQPEQVAWAMSLARLQVDHGDLNAAWQTLDRSMPAGSASADYQGFAGHVLMRLGRSRDAIIRYPLATKLAPNDGRWWLGLGLSQEADGKASEAREAFQQARQCGNLSRELLALVEQKLR